MCRITHRAYRSDQVIDPWSARQVTASNWQITAIEPHSETYKENRHRPLSKNETNGKSLHLTRSRSAKWEIKRESHVCFSTNERFCYRKVLSYKWTLISVSYSKPYVAGSQATNASTRISTFTYYTIYFYPEQTKSNAKSFGFSECEIVMHATCLPV